MVWVKRGDSLHSRARRLVASTPANFVATELGRKRGADGDVGGDFKFVNGEESINEGVSVKDANPPNISCLSKGGGNLLIRMSRP